MSFVVRVIEQRLLVSSCYKVRYVVKCPEPRRCACLDSVAANLRRPIVSSATVANSHDCAEESIKEIGCASSHDEPHPPPRRHCTSLAGAMSRKRQQRGASRSTSCRRITFIPQRPQGQHSSSTTHRPPPRAPPHVPSDMHNVFQVEMTPTSPVPGSSIINSDNFSNTGPLTWLQYPAHYGGPSLVQQTRLSENFTAPRALESGTNPPFAASLPDFEAHSLTNSGMNTNPGYQAEGSAESSAAPVTEATSQTDSFTPVHTGEGRETRSFTAPVALAPSEARSEQQALESVASIGSQESSRSQRSLDEEDLKRLDEAYKNYPADDTRPYGY